MQQYRVNYSLLVGLIVGTLVCSGAVYGLWLFQIERKSGWLISEAEKAVSEKDYRSAEEYYEQYLSIHDDDRDARIKYANVSADLTEQEDATIEELGKAQRSLESMLRARKIAEMPESKKLRRRLINIYGRENIRRWQDALAHLDILLQSDPNDAELQALKANYLMRDQKFDAAIEYSFKLIGYDPKTDTFDIKKATAPNNPEVYTNLALLVRAHQKKPDLAERVLDQMVEVNPDSAQAYLGRGRLHIAWGDEAGGRADAEKAHQLKPEEADVLLFMADSSSRAKDYAKAGEFIAKGKEKYPEDVRFYKAAAFLAMQGNTENSPNSEHYKKALAEIDEGVKHVKGQRGLDLQLFKLAELQIRSQDSTGARYTLEDLKKIRNLRPEVIEYYDSLILLNEGNWPQAKDALNRLRSRISDFGPERAIEVDYNLGLCYERLAQYELARDQYKLVLQQNAQNAPANAGLQRMNAQLDVDDKSNTVDPFQAKMAEITKLPKEERDWTGLDAMLDEIAKKSQWDETTIKIRKAQLMTMREDYDGARKLLTEAYKLSPDNMDVHRLMVQLARLDPKVGPQKALALWEKLPAKFGDKSELRLDKADILMSLYKDKSQRDELKQQLAGLVADIDKLSTPQKIQLWSGMAARYLNLGMADEARQYLRLAADNQPNELPVRLALFSLALDANDDEGMADAQKMILDVVKDQNDSNWLYAEARRKLSLIRRQKAGPETLGEVRALVKKALDERPGWHELYALSAEVELLSGNTATALEQYDKAESMGRPTPLAVAQHIRLLSQIGRWGDAGNLLGRIPETSRQAMLGPLYPEILFRTNQVEEALKQARTATENDPDNVQNQFWYSQLLYRSAQTAPEQQRKEIIANAIKAMQRTTELQPEFPEAWFALIGYNMALGNEDAAQKTLRDAQLVLSGDNLPMFLARSYEALANSSEPTSRWFDAETMYRAIYEAAPDDYQRVQQLAAFYMGPVYQRPDRQAKATPLINKLLRAGAEGKLPAGDGNLSWARRMAAKLLALTGDYPNLVKASNLLRSNSKDGILPVEDKLALAEILASRPEPLSRFQAIALLEEASTPAQPLSEQAEIVLGELYYATGSDWQKYRSKMESVIGHYPNSVLALDTYVRKLLKRNDKISLDQAARYVDQMRKLNPSGMATFELTVRLANKVGKQEEVRKELIRRLPDFSKFKTFPDEQMAMLEKFAQMLIELNDLDTAEKIYRELAARDPKKIYPLAKFLGLHRDAAQCFEELNKVYSMESLPDILNVSVGVVRDRRDKIGDKFDGEIQRWLDAGLRENPDSITLLVMQADVYDLQKKYDEAAAVYRDLLKRNDLVGIRRAVVLNNLAFLLALQGSAGGTDLDALKLVQEAIQIMGPNSDILDTRAVVFISRDKYKEAINDLNFSVTDGPTASKYFHKARAHFGANEKTAAVDAWKKAEELGLSRDAINRMEHDLYDELKSKIDQIRGGSVTQAEPLRKAG